MNDYQKLQILGIVRDWAHGKEKEYNRKCDLTWRTIQSDIELHCWYYRTWVRLDILNKPHLHHWAKSISLQEKEEQRSKRNRRKKNKKKNRKRY